MNINTYKIIQSFINKRYYAITMKKQTKTAVLFSGGKDSGLALMYALKNTDVKCLITLIPESNDSYMFHVPNIKWTKTQAKNIGLPILIQKTKGKKEEELKDLEKAIRRAIKKYKIEGIVSGAIGSMYQKSRIETIANNLKIDCINPLWKKDQFEILEEILKNNFEIIIIGIFGDGLKNIIGKRINKELVEELRKIHNELKINPAGEGGEYESFVLDAPYYKKRLEIKEFSIIREKSGGIILEIKSIKQKKK